MRSYRDSNSDQWIQSPMCWPLHHRTIYSFFILHFVFIFLIKKLVKINKNLCITLYKHRVSKFELTNYFIWITILKYIFIVIIPSFLFARQKKNLYVIISYQIYRRNIIVILWCLFSYNKFINANILCS